MDSGRARTPYVLLTRHFIRQFLENDLISPEADRAQLLAVVGAMLVSLTLFISMFMSAGYAVAFMTPGQAAVSSLTDKFVYLALAMLVTALAAASQWDALAIDARDAAILEPLPVQPGMIWRAKVSAVAIFGAAVAVAVNAFPSLVFPWLLVISLPQMNVIAMFGLVAAHALMTIVAAAFGYLTIIALRETMAAILGPRLFARVSPWAQSALIVVLGGSLLLLPPVSSRIAQRGFDGWRAMTPPMWFLGAYEMAVGGVIADLPRREMSQRQADGDLVASAVYQDRRARFPALARRAGLAVGLTFLLAVAAYSWNARRLPSLSPAQPRARRRRWRVFDRLANAVLLRDPAARAGFHFTLAAMWRSNTHRLTLACAAAVGLAMTVIALWNADLQQGGGAPARVLSAQPLLYGSLLVGFRHMIRVPAELRANWGFQLAWRGRERAFLAGVKHAAVIGLVAPALAVLLPLFVFLLGPQLALLHAAVGLAGGFVLLEALMVTYDKVPFTCTYLPNENMKALAPIYALIFLVGASSFARWESQALSGGGAISVLIWLAVMFVILRVVFLKRARLPQVEFDEVPVTFQRLSLDS